VVAIPVAAFYDDKQAGRGLVRFAFGKNADVLDQAARGLSRLQREP
jgi:N-succinyldiaminopimelate aminotransferase